MIKRPTSYAAPSREKHERKKGHLASFNRGNNVIHTRLLSGLVAGQNKHCVPALFRFVRIVFNFTFVYASKMKRGLQHVKKKKKEK